MKKILTFITISLSIISCKKEEKKPVKTEDTKVGFSTSKTPNTEKEEIKLAISDSANVYKLRYKLEKGKTYPFVLSQKDVQSITMGNKSQSNSNETIDKITFTVNNFDKGIYEIDVNFISKKQVGNSQNESLNIDTEGPEPKNEKLKIFWKVNKALMGNTLKMKMNESGRIISFEGFQPIYEKVTAMINETVKEPSQRKILIESFKQGFNNNALKDQFKVNINLFPEKGLKVGQSFSESVNISPDGKLKNITTFTLKKVENGIAEITVKGGIPKKSDRQIQNGVTQTINFESQQDGFLKLDTQTGWMKTSTITTNTIQSQTLSDGQQTHTAVQKNISTTKINP